MTAVITGAALAVSGIGDLADLLPPGMAATDPDAGLAPRHWDRASVLALNAAGPALAHAGLLERATTADTSVATIISTSYGALEQVCATADTIASSTVVALSPLRMHAMSSHVIGSWMAIQYGLRAPCITLCDGSASGLDAMYWARNLIAAGRAKAVLVVGVEPRTDPVIRLAGPEQAVLDGAGAVVVEAGPPALARGARPLAWLGGYARAADLRAAVTIADGQPLDCWFPPERARDCLVPAVLAGVAQVDLARRLGRSGGALGVIQTAVAATLIGRGDARAVLAACAGPECAAALMLTCAATRVSSDSPYESGESGHESGKEMT